LKLRLENEIHGSSKDTESNKNLKNILTEFSRHFKFKFGLNSISVKGRLGRLG